LTTGSQAIEVGWAAYVDPEGESVAADGSGLDTGVSAESAGTINICTVQVATGSFKIFESGSGVTLIVTAAEIIAASDVMEGAIAYVLD
ncbi:unnamed protein product, partial [marine sediment metagenome]